MANITVIQDETLSNGEEKRYIVVDQETGEVLDDAQGYGFRTKRKAYAAYTYKIHNQPKEEKEE